MEGNVRRLHRPAMMTSPRLAGRTHAIPANPRNPDDDKTGGDSPLLKGDGHLFPSVFGKRDVTPLIKDDGHPRAFVELLPHGIGALVRKPLIRQS